MGWDGMGQEPLLRGCVCPSEAALLAQSSDAVGMHQQGHGGGVDGLTWLETSLGHEPGFIHAGFDVVGGVLGPRSCSTGCITPQLAPCAPLQATNHAPGTACTQCLDQTGPPAPKSMKIHFYFPSGATASPCQPPLLSSSAAQTIRFISLGAGASKTLGMARGEQLMHKPGQNQTFPENDENSSEASEG